MKSFHFLVLGSFCFITLPGHAQQADSTPQNSVSKPSSIGPSLRTHLQLKATQIEDLNALYDNWVNTRGELSQAHERALQILTPLQRVQLDTIIKNQRLRIRDDQYSQLLLVPDGAANTQNQPAEYRTNNNRDNRNRDKDQQRPSKKSRNRGNNGSGSYGVYGGYGYGGPNYGVYGNYGQGNVGVGATIGRYGPSIGVNVGRVFGGRRFR